MKNTILLWIKKEVVLIIAAIAAIVTMFFVTPSVKYFEYIDFRVLVLLFCLMTVVAGLQKNGVFFIFSKKLLKQVKTTRSMCYVLVLLCFFSSMWITNDVSLITFVPFSILILDLAEQKRYLIYVIVMETIAANLGSLLTPIGNPQNLYLYSYYKIDCMEFFRITLPIMIVSFVLISIISFFVKNESIVIKEEHLKDEVISETNKKQRVLHTITYFVLFIICLSTVLHVIDYRITFMIVMVVVIIIDKKIFQSVDYSLLLTFVCFFLFVGNLGNIETLRQMISKLIHTRELVSAIALSQVISNVPAAVLLSNFTDNYRSLVIGTNVGGLGTIIASLASLISYKFYCNTKDAKPVKYLAVFTVFNVIFLAVLCFVQVIS